MKQVFKIMRAAALHYPNMSSVMGEMQKLENFLDGIKLLPRQYWTT